MRKNQIIPGRVYATGSNSKYYGATWRYGLALDRTDTVRWGNTVQFRVFAPIDDLPPGVRSVRLEKAIASSQVRADMGTLEDFRVWAAEESLRLEREKRRKLDDEARASNLVDRFEALGLRFGRYDHRVSTSIDTAESMAEALETAGWRAPGFG